MLLGHVTAEQVELLGGPEHLRRTLAEASQFGRSFDAPELAERLSLKLPNLNARLTALVEAGVLARDRDPDAARGIKYRYTAPTPADLEDADPTELIAAIT